MVPSKIVDALADRINWCHRHPDETLDMGGAARTKIEREFTLRHYEQRQIALYRLLVH